MAKKKLTLKQQLAVPRLRAKLPDSKLTPELLAMRRKNQRLNAPFVDGSSLTNRDVAHQRDAAVKLQYGAQDAQVAQTRRNVEAWFPQYQQELTALNNAQQQRYAAAQKQIVDAASAAQTQQAQSNQALQGSMQADAATRGATYSGTPTAQSQQATNIGQDLANAFAAAIAGQGTAYSGYTSAQQGVGQAAKLGARQQVQAAKTTLAGQKGAFATDYVAKARDNERKNVLEQAAFGLDQIQEANDVAEKRAARKVSRKNTRDRIKSSELQTTQRVNAQAEKAKRAAEQKRQDHIDKVRETSGKALGRIDDIKLRWDTLAGMTNPKQGPDGKPVMKGGKPVMVKPTPNQLKSQLVKEGYSPSEIHLALMIRANKPLAKSDIDLAHKLGIRVPRNLIKPKVKAKPKTVELVAGIKVPTSFTGHNGAGAN